MKDTTQVRGLMTIIRNRTTDRSEFVFYADRIIRLLVEEGLNHLPFAETTVNTPTGAEYAGLAFTGKVCGVSIMRAGEAMEKALRDCCRSIRIGKILIQRDEETHQPKLFYAKLPSDIKDRYCLLLDPMLGASSSRARSRAREACRPLTVARVAPHSHGRLGGQGHRGAARSRRPGAQDHFY